MRKSLSRRQTPVAFVQAILRAYADRGMDAGPALAAAGLGPVDLADPQGLVALERFEALSDWTEDARVLKPAEIDWQAVAAGRQELRVRQLPGKDNAMGKMKFMLPNDLGIYLHDTPQDELFGEAARLF